MATYAERVCDHRFRTSDLASLHPVYFEVLASFSRVSTTFTDIPKLLRRPFSTFVIPRPSLLSDSYDWQPLDEDCTHLLFRIPLEMFSFHFEGKEFEGVNSALQN